MGELGRFGFGLTENNVMLNSIYDPINKGTMKHLGITLAVSVILTGSAHCQDFQNLNFESAYNLPGSPPGSGTSVPSANALPDWTAYDGSLALSDVYYVSNTFPGDTTLVELEGGSLSLSGQFSAGLYPDSSLSQTGMVPENAESLQFEASFASSLYASLGGQNLSFSQLSEGPGYILYGANIPANLDGQMETLIFGVNGPGGTLLDNIEFSTSSIPEPGEWAFVGLWAAFFAVHRRRGRQR